MEIFLDALVFGALFVVLSTLFGGLLSMAKGQSQKSSKMMRYRVMAQAFAVAIIVTAMLLKKAGV